MVEDPEVERGDVFEAFLDPVRGSEQSGQRPVLVVSRQALNEFLDTVVIVPFTTHL
jgi:mRNA interferase MazF